VHPRARQGPRTTTEAGAGRASPTASAGPPTTAPAWPT
jgi:hypothetical protein